MLAMRCFLRYIIMRTPRNKNLGQLALLALVLAGASTACVAISNKRISGLHLNDPELLPFSDMYTVERTRFCLTPIDKNSIVHIEYDNGTNGYDVMLHLETSRVTRSVVFVREAGRYVWIGEEETHYSGRKFQTADGEDTEMMAITYAERAFTGAQKGLEIFYNGDYQHVNFSSSSPTCEQAMPYILQWEKDN